MLELDRFVENLACELAREQHAVAGHEPGALGQPAVSGDEVCTRDAIAVQEYAIGAAARQDAAVADLAGAKSAVLMPDVAKRRREMRGLRLDECARRRPGAVVGDHDFEMTVALARQRTQNRAERVLPIVGRDDDGDEFGHQGPSRAAAGRPCGPPPTNESRLAKLRSAARALPKANPDR